MTKAEQIKNEVSKMSVYQLGEFLLLWPDFMKEQGIDSKEKIEAWLNAELDDNKYYKTSDGWFEFYVNVKTGEKKLKLDDGDICVEHQQDDFYREQVKE